MVRESGRVCGPVVDGAAEGVDEQAAGPAHSGELLQPLEACRHVGC
jgi:hypothetical protein